MYELGASLEPVDPASYSRFWRTEIDRRLTVAEGKGDEYYLTDEQVDALLEADERSESR